MGKCTSVHTQDHTKHIEGVYYIDASSHRVLFFMDGAWHRGAIRENKKKQYLVVYEYGDEWKITHLKKDRSKFISPDLWDVYANDEIRSGQLVMFSF